MDFVLWRIARDCWRHHPHHRPTAHEALQIWEDVNSRLIDPRVTATNPAETHLFPEHIGNSPASLLNVTQEVEIAVHSVIETRAGCVELNATWQDEPRSRGRTAVRLLCPAGNQTVDDQGWSEVSTMYLCAALAYCLTYGDLQTFRDEITRWRRVQHENLLPLYGVCEVKVGGVFQWHAVVPLYLSFVLWNREKLNTMRYMGHTSARPWVKLVRHIYVATILTLRS